MRHALGFRSFGGAPTFFEVGRTKPAPAWLVLTRATEIDGNIYYLPTYWIRRRI
jgi:hypothetical protein